MESEATTETLKQEWLIEWENPLRDEEWKEFFSSLPASCGVYRFETQSGKTLYVGQSKNLKNRLKSYRYVHPERSSRKLLRLVHEVDRIDFEVCDSLEKTLVLEAKRIHELRPKHNKIFTHPESNRFIELKILDQDRLNWKLTSQLPEKVDANAMVFGAFSGTSARSALACLNRMSEFHHRRTMALEQAPLGFFEQMVPDQSEIELQLEPNLTRNECDRLIRKIIEFMEGKNDSWLNRIYGKSGQLTDQVADTWLRDRWKKDYAQLQSFFRFQTQRNRSFASNYAVSSKDPIDTFQLDLLIARPRS